MDKSNAPAYTLTQAELGQLVRESVKMVVSELLVKDKALPTDDLIKIKEVCKMLGVSKVTVFAWVKQGRFPCHHIGTRLYFKRQEILDALTKNTDIVYGQRKRK
jgi:excisionase family DNA binding protein